ncbi:Serine/Threonine kinase family protein [Quillaja saponaria]|uniref:non-specific serine/threonine protein kinase n=1 Tax=Quillaja saponaria TaxID=32244 RepID=A0AAD7L0Q3_QUISA|nr:Serine/Threonine kinase family protein [Quillaja saponaria]KAJ7949103.1 Serine/Threonine kinase family protein [Quillaja saponaria]
MWRFKPFMQKEPTGLEGRFIDVSNLKIHVQKAIAEGWFSCVYLACDSVHLSKQYALKHIICNDDESLGLVMKEISVMKLLKGHPNAVTLYAHTVFDMERTKEAFLVMEFCEKSLLNVLESRGAGYFDEKQVLSIFRDVCNAVFAMHCQLPLVAHRDLKAENLLFEEMGIGEDNIRKHTTPAYRAPEMWDLFLRELTNEKVDIWVLGCLLFRMCFFKSAFDGDSKLQVWLRVNDLLPVNLQKSLPDRPPELLPSNSHKGTTRSTNKSPPMPQRSTPAPPLFEEPKNTSQPPLASREGTGGSLGALWSTQHAKDTLNTEDKGIPIFDEEPPSHHISSKHDRNNRPSPKNVTPNKLNIVQIQTTKRNIHGKLQSPVDGCSKDFALTFFQKDTDHGTGRLPASSMENTTTFHDQTFNTFVAEFDSNKPNSRITNDKSEREKELEAEVENLKVQLKQVDLEKAEITSKFEKLSVICRSQRQEIQDLKQAVSATTPLTIEDTARNQTSPGIRSPATLSQPREKIEGTVWELQQGRSDQRKTRNSEPKSWRAFPEEPKPQQSLSADNTAKSVRSRSGHQNRQAAQLTSEFYTWGFATDSFTAVRAGSLQNQKPISGGNTSQCFGEAKTLDGKSATQPTGWSGF